MYKQVPQAQCPCKDTAHTQEMWLFSLHFYVCYRWIWFPSLLLLLLLLLFPQLMINDQHLELHVLLPHIVDMSFWPRHFVSPVKNELFCVGDYSVYTARRSPPCILLLTKPNATVLLHVGVRVTVHLSQTWGRITSVMHANGMI